MDIQMKSLAEVQLGTVHDSPTFFLAKRIETMLFLFLDWFLGQKKRK
ncbi:hypothetical protein [Metabacillus sp. RGM 3146]